MKSLQLALLALPTLTATSFAGEADFVALSGHELVADGRSYVVAYTRSLDPSAECVSESGRRWACGEFAKRALQSYLQSSSLSCAPVQDQSLEVATIYCTVEASDVGFEMVRHGWSRTTDEAPAWYVEAMEAARAAGIGFWATGTLGGADFELRAEIDAGNVAPAWTSSFEQ